MGALLIQVQDVAKRNLLALELEMRIYYALAEAYLITEDFAQLHHAASQAALLAPIIGLKSVMFSARVLVAGALHYLGQSQNAIRLLRDLQQEATLNQFKLHAISYLAEALFYDGDFIGVIELAEQQTESDLESQAHLDALKTCTLLRKPTQRTMALPNRKETSLKIYLTLHKAFSLPLFADERKICFRTARTFVTDATHRRDTWQGDFGRILSAYCSIRAGDYGLVLHGFPSFFALQNYPIWVRAFGLATLLESVFLIHDKELRHTIFFESHTQLQELLNTLDQRLLEQIAQALRLYTPYALAYMAVLGGVNEVVLHLGQSSILNLKARPIRVHDQEGLRPIQALEFCLRSFGLPHTTTRMGGGQLEAFKAALNLPYGENLFWFEPVAPSRLIVGLLEAAEHLPNQAAQLQMAAKQVYKRFGLFPRMQQTTQEFALDALEESIQQALFGNVGVKDIWRLVELYGGMIRE